MTDTTNGNENSKPVPRFPVCWRVALLDNDRRALESVRDMLANRLAPSKVIWAVEDGAEAIRRCSDARQTPDLLLVDMSLEGLQGVTVCRRIRTASMRPVMLGITSFSLNFYRTKAAAAGAQGLVDKSDDEDILNGIEQAMNGAMPGFDTVQVAHLRLKHSPLHAQLLTTREEQVISLYAERGLSNKEIGAQLGIADTTVRKHLQNIATKFKVESTRQAAALWLNETW